MVAKPDTGAAHASARRAFPGNGSRTVDLIIGGPELTVPWCSGRLVCRGPAGVPGQWAARSRRVGIDLAGLAWWGERYGRPGPLR